MSTMTTKQQLFDMCKRRLGDPVIQINVTDEQIDDAWTETLEFWRQYHPDGTEKVYIQYQVTGSSITIADATNFVVGEKLKTVAQPGPSADIVAKNGNVLTINAQEGGRFAVNNAVTGSTSNATSTVTAITLGDLDNKFITVDPLIYGVTNVYPFSAGTSSSNLFSLEYQLRLNEVGDLSSSSLQYYVQTMTNLGMMSSILNGKPLFRFNRLQHKVYIDVNWGLYIQYGEWLLLEGYKAINPDVDTYAYNDPWLVKHLTASIKKQWGTNLKKYQGMQLPGGVTVDGQTLHDEAVQEMGDLESDLIQNGGILEFSMG